MNYELAKKLKEAGFPQKPEYEYVAVGLGEQVTYPTLSELIKACGDRFDDLEKRGKVYFAFGSSKDSARMKIKPYLGGGSTPEEAVANLWLELQVKD